VDIGNHDSYYTGQNYAAFITYEGFDNDYANNMSYMNRLNLEVSLYKNNRASSRDKQKNRWAGFTAQRHLNAPLAALIKRFI